MTTKNREEKAKAFREYYRTFNGQYAQLKKHAKRRGIVWDITKREARLFFDKPCEYCKTEVKGLHFDRIDNDGYYTISNVVSCCLPCNSAKKSMDLLRWIRFLTAKEMGHRLCVACDDIKDESNFYRSGNSISSRCKPCEKVNSLKRYAEKKKNNKIIMDSNLIHLMFGMPGRLKKI